LDQRGRYRCRRLAIGLGVALVSMASLAQAEAADPAVAEALFRSGKQHLATKDYDHACPMFADSFRADPATGTLLALAICLEGQGKVASAFRAFTEVAVRSKKESRPDREKIARTKAANLEPQVSLLTVVVPPSAREIDGLTIKRNGTSLGAASWGKTMLIDGGAVTIEASAPGMKTWKTTVTVAESQDVKTVTVPVLADADEAAEDRLATARAHNEAPSAPPITPVVPPPSPSSVDVAPSASLPGPEMPRRSSAWQGAGAATFVAGVASLGFGTVFGLRAKSKNDDSKPECQGNICTAQGRQDRWDAHDAGNMATYGFIAGGVLTVGGAAMYLLGRPSSSLSACAGGTCFEAVPATDAHTFGGIVRGSFW
jgi:hypothetical protein